MYQELSDEQLEMVAGGTSSPVEQNAIAVAFSVQAAKTYNNSASGGTATATVNPDPGQSPNIAAAASTPAAGNISQVAYNTAIAPNFYKSFNQFQF